MKILEISRIGFFAALHPGATHWIRWGPPLTSAELYDPAPFTLTDLVQTLRRLRTRSYDLVVLPAIHPDHRFDAWQKLAAKSALQFASRRAMCSQLLLRLMGSCPHIIVDIRDERHLCETTLRLFPQATHYFKRELDFDRDVEVGIQASLCPLPLFVPDERFSPPAQEKDIDVFFAGAICNDVRADAVKAANEMTARGLRVFIPREPLPFPEFLATLARSWLVLSPEGYGWDCYRHYEACLAGSVPVINRPSYRRCLYLRDGVHCIYYDMHDGSLAQHLVTALADKERLLRIAQAGRTHVLANHTRSAVARSMIAEAAKAVPSLSQSDEVVATRLSGADELSRNSSGCEKARPSSPRATAPIHLLRELGDQQISGTPGRSSAAPRWW